MDAVRSEIMPGVWLTALQTDKFKTACMSVNLLTQLERENASSNALVPYVLRRGTGRFPDMAALSAKLDSMYGAAIEPVVRRIGEIQSVGFYASFPEDKLLPEGGVMAETAELMAEILLRPNTRGGLFLPEYVDSERGKLVDLIRSRINDKQGYALQRCIEEMCCYENYSVLRFGDEQSAHAIRYDRLTKHYHTLCSSSPVEMFYCGAQEPQRVALELKKAFATLPRGEIDYDVGTDVRLNAVEAQPRTTIEELGVEQGKLVMGFRLGEAMDEENPAVVRVMNTLYGGCVTSKLFSNVREKLSLCYYASSLLETHKGLMFVSSGIDEENFDAARDEILAQLDSLRRGEITGEELKAAKNAFASDMRAAMDSQGELEGYYLGCAVDGEEISPMELAALAEEVTAEEVSRAAKCVECDEIYFLKGSEEACEDGD
jgi:predicted Zn-dependent peptidase